MIYVKHGIFHLMNRYYYDQYYDANAKYDAWYKVGILFDIISYIYKCQALKGLCSNNNAR